MRAGRDAIAENRSLFAIPSGGLLFPIHEERNVVRRKCILERRTGQTDRLGRATRRMQDEQIPRLTPFSGSLQKKKKACR